MLLYAGPNMDALDALASIDAELQALSHPLGLSPEAAQDDAAEVDKALEAALED